MKPKTLLPLLLSAVVGLFTGVSCDDAETFFDCQAVCERYRDCHDPSYDVGACRSRCRDRAEQNENVRQAADACEDCIDDMSCTSATFSCAGSCLNIVP